MILRTDGRVHRSVSWEGSINLSCMILLVFECLLEDDGTQMHRPHALLDGIGWLEGRHMSAVPFDRCRSMAVRHSRPVAVCANCATHPPQWCSLLQ